MPISPPEIVAAAIALDFLWGDPSWLPHPVVFIGRLISWLELKLRHFIKSEKLGGVLLLFITTSATALLTWLILRISTSIAPILGFAVAVIISSTTIATRSLHKESKRVADALKSGKLLEAREKLSWIVGRDTKNLQESEIWRALLETVAENCSDGIIAPIFWLSVGGPVAAMFYKSVNTLDSMVGYKNERYKDFGTASARMDDLLNYIPARLTATLMIISAPIIGASFAGSLSVYIRDRKKHPSPNSGHPEAAAAGALGVRFGGVATYGGVESIKEYIGNPEHLHDEKSYNRIIKLIYMTTILMSAIVVGLLSLMRS